MSSLLRTTAALRNTFRTIRLANYRFMSDQTFDRPPFRSSYPSSSSSTPQPNSTDETVLEHFSGPPISDAMVSQMCQEPFPKEVSDILMAPLDVNDVEAKPGFGGQEPTPYLPEIKYRRVLNRAFGPGGWALVPRGQVTKFGTVASREYALFARGRLVSVCRGQAEMNRGKGLEMALEGVRSNALMRCCKDLGIASELWDPSWIKNWKRELAAKTRGQQRR